MDDKCIRFESLLKSGKFTSSTESLLFVTLFFKETMSCFLNDLELDFFLFVFFSYSLMTNAFTIDSAEQSPTTRRAEQQARGVQRRFNIAPLRINYDENASITPEKQIIRDDLSFYDGTSPQQSPLPCPVDACMEGDLSPETSPVRYEAILPPSKATTASHPHSSSKSAFKFLQPCGTAPRKTPAKSPSSLRIFHSLSNGSTESADDEYIELFEMESIDDNDDAIQQLPNDLSSLLSGDIRAVRNTPEQKHHRPAARRSLSLNDSNECILRRTRSSLFEKTATPERQALQSITNGSSTTPLTTKNTFKRPEPPTTSPTQCKRLKFENYENIEPPKETSRSSNLILKKSISMDEGHIKTALARCK